MYITLETERLILRPINLLDTEFVFELVNSKGWLQFIGNRNIADVSGAKSYIQKILDNENFYFSVFELKESRKAIGIVTFLKREGEKYPDIGFAQLPEFEKNGYTLEACKAYLNEIEKLNTYDNIIAITTPENIKSIKLLNKLGLQFFGGRKRKKETISYFSLKN